MIKRSELIKDPEFIELQETFKEWFTEPSQFNMVEKNSLKLKENYTINLFFDLKNTQVERRLEELEKTNYLVIPKDSFHITIAGLIPIESDRSVLIDLVNKAIDKFSGEFLFDTIGHGWSKNKDVLSFLQLPHFEIKDLREIFSSVFSIKSYPEIWQKVSWSNVLYHTGEVDNSYLQDLIRNYNLDFGIYRATSIRLLRNANRLLRNATIEYEVKFK